MHGMLLAVFCVVVSGGSVSAGGVEDASDDVGDFVLERTDEKPVEAIKRRIEGAAANETVEGKEVNVDCSSDRNLFRVPVDGLF